MVKDNSKEVYEIIDRLVDMEQAMEKHYIQLRGLGFRKNEANEIIECFVVDKLKKLMEG